MNANYQTLVKQIVDEVQMLPESLIREVLDFVGYLRTKYELDQEEQHDTMLATFGSWEDDREPEKIIEDIYTSRTISELQPDL